MTPRSVAANLLFAIVSVLVGLLLAELGLRALQGLGVARSLGETDLFGRPGNAARMIRSDDPKLEVQLDPTDPQINSHGFRDHDYAWEKPPGAFRILALGDSVTYGLGVSLDSTWPKVLEARLNAAGDGRYEVLNLAASGYGTAQEIRLLETRGLRYDPDLVLVGYVLNDLMPTAVMFQAVAVVQAERRFYRRWVRHSQLAALIWVRVRQLRRPDVGLYENPDIWVAVSEPFDRFAELSRESGISGVVAIFPRLVAFDDYPYADIHAQVATTAREDGLEVLDLLGAFETVDPETVKLSPLDVTHPNADGHLIAAERIHEYLVDKGFLGPSGRAPGHASPSSSRSRQK